MLNLMSDKKKLKRVNLSTKLAIIKYLDDGHNMTVTVDKFSLFKGTVQSLKRNRVPLLREAKSNRALFKARIVQQTDINVILWRWFSTTRPRGYSISGPILQEKAKQIASRLGTDVKEFSASKVSLKKWKQRNNVKSYKICRESGNADLTSAEQWSTSLESLLAGYDLKNVFNMDETSFFFRDLPDSTLNHVADSCKGGKQGKDRVTVALTCSTMGEKLPPWIIGKSKNPCSFWNVDMSKFKAKYLSSAKTWMINPLFNIYLKDLDEFFKRQGRKILLFLDYAMFI